MEATNRSYWILVDPESYLEAVPAVLAAAPGARVLLASPVVVVEGDESLASTVARLPGVHAVSPVMRELAGVVAGLDAAVQLCVGVADGVGLAVASPGVVTVEAAAGEGAPAYPTVWSGVTGQVVGHVVWAAVNMSISPRQEQFAPTERGDVVNFLTRYAAQFLVPVVAVGNHHDAAADFETVSPWAEPTWVVSVGATLDEGLTVEAPWSARATPGGAAVGPDVLAWGANLFSPGDMGTSFAAARVTGLITLIRAWLLQVVADIDRRDRRPFGVPLVGAVVLDRGFDPTAFPRVSWPALPVLRLADDAWAGINDSTRRLLADTLVGAAGPAITRTVLMAAARRGTPREARLSAPAIGTELLVAFLSSTTAADLINLAGIATDTPGVPGAPLFRPGDVERLRVMVDNSAPLWNFDIDRRRGFPRPQIPEGAP